ncbi:MAG: TonB-dependent receptor [Prevotellaceae bacterium]|nr:TonB-dependent receptor [Prevotellaceae bacterium]
MKIRLYLAMLMMCFSMQIMAQNTSVKGQITDESGAPVMGAVVTVEGKENVGTVTDIDGNFALDCPTGCNLLVSYVGYKKQTVSTKGRTTLAIVLEEEHNVMQEVVVVGYGTMKKSDLTSAISSISADELAATSVTSFDQGLQGRASGVVVMNTSGQPGGGTSIRIRGTSSINGNNEPLYVIDGMPIISDAGSMSTSTLKNPALNPLTSISPGDIESIEILKDASATAIYGSRGANGVILVTTKQGKAGKARVTFNAKVSIQNLSKKMDMLNARQLADLANEVADNDGIERKAIFAGLNNLSRQSTDWQDEIFRTAPLQNYDISVSGGTNQTSYLAAANLLLQDGIIIGSDFGKGSFRFNFSQDISKSLKLNITTNASYSRSNGVVTNSEGGFASSITSWALEMNPGLGVYNEDGTYVYENNTANPNVGNPVQDAYEALNRNTTFRTIDSAFLEYTVIKGLTLKAGIGIDYFSIKDQAFAPGNIKRAESNNGYAQVGTRDGYNWNWESTANYTHTFGDHTFSALAGFTAQKFHSEYVAVATADFADGFLGFNSIQSGSQKQLASSGVTEWQMLSYLARANYNYADRYLISVSGRVDGSSKFGIGNKYGFFPSVSGAWRVSEEAFMKNQSVFSNLKLRLSYGKVGNEGIASYSSQGLLFNTEAYFGTNTILTGLTPYTISNQDLKWETTSQYNLGLDFGFFDNRLNFTIDTYIKKTSDLLLNMPVSFHTGYDSVMKNVGNLENRGFDFTINAVPFTGKFNWTIDVTAGYNQNEITNLAGTMDELNGASVLGITYWTKITEGKPIGTLYGYKTDGIVQLNEDPSTIPFFAGKTLAHGDRKYVDKNGDNEINEKDLYELGNANPDFTFGFNNTFGYNFRDHSSISLNVFLQGQLGNEIVNFNKFSLESLNGFKNNSTAVLNRWTVDNPTNLMPRATTKSAGNILSDHFIESGSYMRIKDVTLSYTFPKELIKKFYCSDLTVFASAKNLFTFTNYTGYDPEVSRFANNNLSMGADYGTYPMCRSYEFGLKVNF